MPTVADTAKLLRIKAEVDALPPPDRLRMAAELIALGYLELAETIAGNVVDELRLHRLLNAPVRAQEGDLG